MLLVSSKLRAADEVTIQPQLRLLQQPNHALQEQLQRQQTLIETLTRKVERIEPTTTQSGREIQELAGEVKNLPRP